MEKGIQTRGKQWKQMEGLREELEVALRKSPWERREIAMLPVGHGEGRGKKEITAYGGRPSHPPVNPTVPHPQMLLPLPSTLGQ